MARKKSGPWWSVPSEFKEKAYVKELGISYETGRVFWTQLDYINYKRDMNAFKKDLIRDIKKINRRLLALEKAGLTESSREYQIIKKYSEQVGNPFYKRLYNQTFIPGYKFRMTTNLDQFSKTELKEIRTIVGRALQAQSLSVKGVERIHQKRLDRSREKIEKLQRAEGIDTDRRLTNEEIGNYWAMARKIFGDKMTHIISGQINEVAINVIDLNYFDDDAIVQIWEECNLARFFKERMEVEYV